MIFYFRLVYKWFLLLYKVSYFIGILGYIIMMATFMGFYLFFGVKPHVWMDIGIMMMFYALYYGVMARDVAEIITEKMVSGIGVTNNLDLYNIIQANSGHNFMNDKSLPNFFLSITNLVECQPVDLMQMFAPYVEISF